MNRQRVAGIAALSVFALALVGCAAAGPSEAEPTSQAGSSSAELGQSLEASVAEMLADRGIPGAVFVVTQDGAPLWEYAYNNAEADAEPVALDQFFGYRSITKSFTVTALLTLVDAGKVSLDDPISTYVAGVPNGDRMTLQNLAEMRSGLENYSSMPYLGEVLQADPTAVISAADLIGPALAAPPLFEPDAKFMYSNTNTVLLGEVITQVTGQDWSEYLAAEVLDPIGLGEIAYPVDLVMPEPAAVPYSLLDGVLEELPTVNPTFFGAAGGLFGTAKDLAAWADELGSGSVLTPETQAERLAAFGSTSDDKNSPDYDEYGMGMGKIDGYVGHTGNGLGFQVLAMNDPETGVSVAILLNSTTEDADLPANLFRLMVPVLSTWE